MRIAVVNNFFPPRVGGSAHVADGLARYYASRGHTVLVLAAGYGGAPPLEKRDGITIARLPSWTLPETRFSFNFDITFALKSRNLAHVFRLLNRFKPDVIHQHGQFFDLTWQTGLWAHRHHVPTVLTVHTRLASPHMLASGVFRILDAAVVDPILRKLPPSRVVALDILYESYIRERYAIPEDRIVEIPIGIELDRYRDVEPAEIRERFDLGPGPVALSLGHVIPLRDRVALVKALPRVLERHPDFKVLVIGGVYYWRFLELAQELGVAEAIVTPGAIPRADIPGICAACDLEVHDLQGTGVGIATLEAMAAGTPAIISVRPDIWPSAPLVSGEQCVLVPLYDTGALVTAICDLVENKELRDHVGSAGREYVFEHFDFAEIGERNLRLLAEVTREASGGGRSG